MTDWDHGIVIQYDGTNYFIVNDGKRVARLGPEEPWAVLQPGYELCPTEDTVKLLYKGQTVEEFHKDHFECPYVRLAIDAKAMDSH
jgi:hypothetical protein